MTTPSVGRIVMTVGGAATANGTDTAPAIVTRVFNPQCVNVTVFRDAQGTPLAATSVTLYDTEDEARAAVDKAAADGLTVTAVYWPARV